MRIGTENVVAAENDQDVTVVGAQEVQIEAEIQSVHQLKRIAHQGTSIGIVGAIAEKARETDIKADHRLAILSQAENWELLQERVDETGRGRESLVDVMVGSARADVMVMMPDGLVKEEIGVLVVETEMGGQILEVMNAEMVVEGRTEEESDAAERRRWIREVMIRGLVVLRWLVLHLEDGEKYFCTMVGELPFTACIGWRSAMRCSIFMAKWVEIGV